MLCRVSPWQRRVTPISEIDWKRFEKIEDTNLHEGDNVKIQLLEIDPKTGKFKLSRRSLLEKPADYVEPERRPRRREEGERGERRRRE